MSQEVELKIFVGPHGSELKLRETLRSRYRETVRRTEVDIYFNSIHRDFIAAEECLRIRIAGDAGELTWKPPTTKEMLDRRQYWKQELNLSLGHQADLMRTLLSKIDFVEYATVEKDRLEFEVDKTSKVVIDVVKGVGVFLEIETMADNEAEAVKKNEQLLSELALPNATRVVRPYRDIVKDYSDR